MAPNRPPGPRPTLAPARPATATPSLLDQAIEATISARGFDPDIYHVMDQTDDALIADEVMNGAAGAKFVYSFSIKGTEVQGVSVIGARQLARSYGGLKHRIVASIEKRGSLFTFVSYPSDNRAMNVHTAVLPDLEDEDDYYTAVVEVEDIKSGNSIQVEKTELKFERRRDGSAYDRPHFRTIAQAKAYRNAVLDLIPQDVQIKFRQKCLSMGQAADITSSAIDEKRSGIVSFAAAKAIPISRSVIFGLGMAEISGLSEAARTKDLAKFTRALAALGALEGVSTDGEILDDSNPSPGQQKTTFEESQTNGGTGRPAETSGGTASSSGNTGNPTAPTTTKPTAPAESDGVGQKVRSGPLFRGEEE